MASAILLKMLERLFASLVNGPGLNCRPHSSRQRVDMSQLSRLLDGSAEGVLQNLLGEGRKVRLMAKAARPAAGRSASGEGVELSEEQRRVARQWQEQQGLLGKLRTIAEDARTYEQDTGVHVLNIGFPLLSVAARKGAGRIVSRRILAPVAFIPVTLEVKAGSSPGVEISRRGEGVDLVRPNIALLAWLEQQTGKKTPELFDDREAENPWREIRELMEHAARALTLELPAALQGDGFADGFTLKAAPRTEKDQAASEMIAAAVLGLYPMANEGLLRDTQAMCEEMTHRGPVASFLNIDVNLSVAPAEQAGEDQAKGRHRVFSQERLVAAADPCQAQAALLARNVAGLVIHGPPGTGKSQTITNIIGDHLARGQRVLMVCDKRTALEVVAHRLDHLGFGPLVAIVHDPQRDQRDLYRKIRERLEGLGDVRTNSRAAGELEKIDRELQGHHDELLAYWKSLMTTGAAGMAASFHELMGEWLANGAEASLAVSDDGLAGVALEDGRQHERLLREIFDRGEAADYPGNAFAGSAQISLADFLARAPGEFAKALDACAAAARESEVAIDRDIPELGADGLQEQGALRLEVAERLEKLTVGGNAAICRLWAAKDHRAVQRAHARMNEIAGAIDIFRGGKLDADLIAVARGNVPTVAEVSARLGKLAEYGEIARQWNRFFCFHAKKMGREVLQPLGLPLKAAAGERASAFLIGLKARLMIRDALLEMGGEAAPLPEDADLAEMLGNHAEAISLLHDLGDDAGATALLGLVRKTLDEPLQGARVVEALRKSAVRAAALLKAQGALVQTGLMNASWLEKFASTTRKGANAAEMVEKLRTDLPRLEHILRIRDGVAALPLKLGSEVERLLRESVTADAGCAVIDKGLLAAEISRRLRTDPVLQTMDGHRLKSTFDRYRRLDAQKKGLVCEAVVHLWVHRQQDRLLASTMSRSSPMGADLRRRLTMRGERAMRLRQVVEAGRKIAGGDPLFDMCPVWMASPETVAQIFSREELFDVVIFDEASQCRLEEALPVLTRAKRVVIAGDPKQLPPTRFFESVAAASEVEDAESEQDLFEHQQGEVEDLLTAALNLSIENAYLDVHYRSRNSDLIAFSNEQFYSDRLQAIPGHPANATRFCPLTLYRVDGIYEERTNEKEAEQVCRIVRDLLRRAEPPSIGIASFNLPQRDLIVEKLDAMAGEDADFAKRLAAARVRRGSGSFDGLFVKNLENVQGDERDHVIISTTYGPQADGKFYQRFGPLGRAGGGRRLNVLVTRAREEIHLVTSIPRELYANLPPVPPGQTAGGAWLLYAYLHYAETIGALYAAQAAKPGGEVVVDPIVRTNIQRASLPSHFAETLAQQLKAKHRLGSVVHWGNDGFCVDVAMAHPLRADDVTIGVLCDGLRYLQAGDAVEWDIFRTAVHESQGWTLHRVWTPQFFRDAAGHVDAIAAAVRRHVLAEKPRDVIDVVRTETPETDNDVRRN